MANCDDYNNKSLKFISQMNFEEKHALFDSFDTVFCDCDGVIWNMMFGPIAGSANSIEKLRQMGKKVVFVTNNSTLSSEEYVKKFKNCNIQINKEDIVHPAQTICNYLKHINFDGLIYCIASVSFKNIVQESGFQIVEEENVSIKTFNELHAAIYSQDPVKAVIIDVDFNLTAVKLMRAQVHLQNSNCLFLGGAADKFINFGKMELLGPQLFIELLEKATNRQAQVYGKPGLQLKEVLERKYINSVANRVLFIGDSLSSDIKFAKICGFQSILVAENNFAKSIKEEEEDEEKCDHIPDYVVNSLADLLN